MTFKRPPSESQPRPSVVDLRARPHKAVDVLRATETEPESSLMFDPKVDISPASEKAMFDELNEYRYNKWFVFCEMAMRLSILFPDRKADLRLGETEFNGIKVKFDEYRNKKWWGFGNIAMPLSILYPDRIANLKLGKKEFNGMKADLDRHRRNNSWLDFSCIAMNLSILYPDRKADLELGESEFNGMKAKLNKYRNNDWWNFCDMAMRLSILYPDRKADIQLGESEFNGIKFMLNECRRNNYWWGFSYTAMCLTILSAERAEITEDGRIKLTQKKKDLAKKSRPLPIVSMV